MSFFVNSLDNNGAFSSMDWSLSVQICQLYGDFGGQNWGISQQHMEFINDNTSHHSCLLPNKHVDKLLNIIFFVFYVYMKGTSNTLSLDDKLFALWIRWRLLPKTQLEGPVNTSGSVWSHGLVEIQWPQVLSGNIIYTCNAGPEHQKEERHSHNMHRMLVDDRGFPEFLGVWIIGVVLGNICEKKIFDLENAWVSGEDFPETTPIPVKSQSFPL